jgi:tetratricopeptide (TPR) repeat protein
LACLGRPLHREDVHRLLLTLHRVRQLRLGELRDRLAAGADPYWAGQVEIQRRVALAWQLHATGRSDAALAELQAAADAEELTDKAAVTPGPFVPARESLAELLLALGRGAEAQRAAEAALVYEPNRLRTLAVAARAAASAGDAGAARRHAAQLAAVAGAVAVRPELAGMADYLR